MAAPKRRFGEKERTILWAEMISEEVALTGISRKKLKGRTLGKKLQKKAKELNLSAQEKNKLPTPEAWRWYQEGNRTPGKDVRNAVDVVITKSGGRPLGWIVAGPGEVELVPVWLWPAISQSGIPTADAEKCAEMERKFGKRLPSGRDILVRATLFGVIPPPVWLEFRFDADWPNKIMIPAEVAATMPKEEGAAFPHLLPQKKETESNEEIRRALYSYRQWSTSPHSAEEDGEEWLHALRLLPGNPFYSEKSLLADPEATPDKRAMDKLKKEIRAHFGREEGD